MSRDPPNTASDWTAAVEGAVQAEIERRRFWLRLYLAFLLLLTVLTLILMALGAREVFELRREVEPMASSTRRLEAVSANLGKDQSALDARLRQAEIQMTSLAADVRAALSVSRALSAAAAVPRAVLDLPRQVERLSTNVSALDRRVRHVERESSAAADRQTRADARLDQRLSRVEADRLRRVEDTVLAMPQGAQASAPTPASTAIVPAAPAVDAAQTRRFEALERRLDRLERSTWRSGTADLER